MGDPESRAYDDDVKRYAIERLLEHLTQEELDRLKPCIMVFPDAAKPSVLPVPSESRDEAMAFLVHVLIGSALHARDMVDDELGPAIGDKIRKAWQVMTGDYAEMVAADIGLMRSHGLVHRPRFYGFDDGKVVAGGAQ